MEKVGPLASACFACRTRTPRKDYFRSNIVLLTALQNFAGVDGLVVPVKARTNNELSKQMPRDVAVIDYQDRQGQSRHYEHVYVANVPNKMSDLINSCGDICIYYCGILSMLLWYRKTQPAIGIFASNMHLLEVAAISELHK